LKFAEKKKHRGQIRPISAILSRVFEKKPGSVVYSVHIYGAECSLNSIFVNTAGQTLVVYITVESSLFCKVLSSLYSPDNEPDIWE
jgi:hypothetical protein